VAAQTYRDFEHIVADGGSRDETMAIVERHRHERLSASSEPDRGIYDAMNKGLARATGDYVLFLNADDYLAGPESLGIAARQLGQHDVDLLFGDTRFVARDGRTPHRRYYSSRGFSPWWLKVGAMPPHPSMFLRRTLMQRLGGYDDSYRIAADFDFVARAVLRHKATFASLPVALTVFRMGGVSTAGLASKLAVNREVARSLTALGQRLAAVSAWLKLPLKLAQYRLHSSDHAIADWPPPPRT
jgi:glycosyltransferase involved in cell wall biosynthesis